MTHMEKVRRLRMNTAVHYNCCQCILAAFSQEMGLTEAQAYALGAHFGAGMRHGSTCGTLTGALMVLGAMGYDEQQAAGLLRQFRETHGDVNCAALLKASHDRGEDRKEHCSGLIYEVTEMLEQILERRGTRDS